MPLNTNRLIASQNTITAISVPSQPIKKKNKQRLNMCLSCWLVNNFHGSRHHLLRPVEETCVLGIWRASLLLQVVDTHLFYIAPRSFLTVRWPGMNSETYRGVQLLPNPWQPCLNWQSALSPRYSCSKHYYRDEIACLCVSANYPPNFDDWEVPMPSVACSAWLSRSLRSTLSCTYWASSYCSGSVQAPGSSVPRLARSSIAVTMA